MDEGIPLKGYPNMNQFSRNSHLSQTSRDRFLRTLVARLQTTATGLGLVRFQLDVGRIEEAREALALLQEEFRLLRLGVDGEAEAPRPKRKLARRASEGSSSFSPLPL
jgi:hypothetical protein